MRSLAGEHLARREFAIRHELHDESPLFAQKLFCHPRLLNMLYALFQHAGYTSQTSHHPQRETLCVALLSAKQVLLPRRKEPQSSAVIKATPPRQQIFQDPNEIQTRLEAQKAPCRRGACTKERKTARQSKTLRNTGHDSVMEDAADAADAAVVQLLVSERL